MDEMLVSAEKAPETIGAIELATKEDGTTVQVFKPSTDRP